MSELAAARRRLRAVRDRLRTVSGIPVIEPHRDPIAELVLTVLSQSTNDRNRDVAYLRLRARLPSWAAVRDAPLEEVVEAIRPGGLFRQKAPRIQEILRAVPEDGAGEPTLDHLPTLSLAAARDELTALPGVGRKTAACVLLFSFGLQDVPVDTHVSRVGTRLGLLPAGSSLETQHDALLALLPHGQALEVHMNLLRHGRRTCHARTPQCDACVLRRGCPSRR